MLLKVFLSVNLTGPDSSWLADPLHSHVDCSEKKKIMVLHAEALSGLWALHGEGRETLSMGQNLDVRVFLHWPMNSHPSWFHSGTRIDSFALSLFTAIFVGTCSKQATKAEWCKYELLVAQSSA